MITQALFLFVLHLLIETIKLGTRIKKSEKEWKKP